MGEVRGALLADGGWGTEAQLVTTVVPWMRVRVLPKHHLHETLLRRHTTHLLFDLRLLLVA